jgi:ATP-dependent DNA helicase RecG
MKRSDLEILLQEGEGSTLEYKESLSSSFARDLVAFAKGADKVHVLDRKDFDGGVVADIEDAMRFIERNTRTAWRIETLRRENIPEYPTKALREAVTNAVMHRDWFMEGANVFVELYTDRIEVVSPGGLPKGMLPADLGHKSVRRNALIADLLHRIEFIEKAGTGIKRIRDEARAQGCPEPVWEANGFVTVIFRPNPAVRAQAEAQGAGGTATAPEVTPQVPRKYPASTPQVLAILNAASTGEQTREELQSAAGVKDREHFRKQYLKPLLTSGLLEATIPDKPRSSKQRYRITRRGQELLTTLGKEK